MKALLDLFSSPTVTAAIVAAVVSLGAVVMQRRREARAVQQDVFASAYAAYAAYREMPYVVRRRGAAEPEAERRRISESMRDIQERLNYYLAWTHLHAPGVGVAYSHLVRELRRVAGRAVAAEWQRPPIEADAQMNIPDIDLSPLDAAEESYLAAVERHLHPHRNALDRWKGRLRRSARRVPRAQPRVVE